MGFGIEKIFHGVWLVFCLVCCVCWVLRPKGSVNCGFGGDLMLLFCFAFFVRSRQTINWIGDEIKTD